MNTEIKKISIPIDDYIRITGCDDKFENTSVWDEDNGLVIMPNSTGNYKFNFIIKDHQKFFLAQIKYGL